jgi:hypothetical protein
MLAFGTGIVTILGNRVPSCSARILNATFNDADGLITCEMAGDVLAVKGALPA